MRELTERRPSLGKQFGERPEERFLEIGKLVRGARGGRALQLATPLPAVPIKRRSPLWKRRSRRSPTLRSGALPCSSISRR
jgi:hypothetical protein